MRKILVFILFLFLISGCATHPSRVTSIPYPRGTGGVNHTLVKGETIWRLAETYGVRADTIMKVNRIRDPNQLKVGTRLRIPTGKAPTRTLPYLPTTYRWRYVVIHHSATEVGNAELFDVGHRRRGFWNGLGYHFVIDNGTSGTRSGQMETSHRWNHQMDGAHCNAGDMNQKGIGICLVGNFDEEKVSRDQFDSLVWLVRQLQAKYKIPRRRVLQHHEVKNGTHCPGKNFPWSEFKKRIL